MTSHFLIFLACCILHHSKGSLGHVILVNGATKFIFKVATNDTMPPFGLAEGFREFKGCLQSNCYYTEDINLLGNGSSELFDAIIVPVPSFRTDDQVQESILSHIVKRRCAKQNFVMVIREAPWPDMSWINEKYLSQDFFNWTWSYRQDSDFFSPIAFLSHRNDQERLDRIQSLIGLDRPNKLPHHNDYLDLITKKNKLVFWVVSNCNTRSKREHLVERMKEYIPVDVFGSCGDMACVGDCFVHLAHEYKFYLAFENAICPDYVTEKFFRTLRHNYIYFKAKLDALCFIF